MAHGKKTGGKNWVKGQSGNPKGASLVSREIREIKKLNKIEVEKVLNKFLFEYSLEELVKYAKDPTNPTLDAIVAKILVTAYNQGDQMRINWIFERLVGKVTEKVEHQLPKPTMIKLLNNEGSIVLGAQITSEDENGKKNS